MGDTDKLMKMLQVMQKACDVQLFAVSYAHIFDALKNVL